MCTISTKFYKSHRFPAAIFSQSVWLYFCFALSFRGEKLMMDYLIKIVNYIFSSTRVDFVLSAVTVQGEI